MKSTQSGGRCTLTGCNFFINQGFHYIVLPLARQAQQQTRALSQPLSPTTLIAETHRAGLFSFSDTELAVLKFQPLSIQKECPSGSMSMSVIPDMLCSTVLHDSLPSDLLIFLNATHLCSRDFSSVV